MVFHLYVFRNSSSSSPMKTPFIVAGDRTRCPDSHLPFVTHFLHHKFIMQDSLPRSLACMACTWQFSFNLNRFTSLHHTERPRLQSVVTQALLSAQQDQPAHFVGSISSKLLINVLSGEEPHGIPPANSCEEFICRKYPGSVPISTIFPTSITAALRS